MSRRQSGCCGAGYVVSSIGWISGNAKGIVDESSLIDSLIHRCSVSPSQAKKAIEAAVRCKAVRQILGGYQTRT